MRSRMAGTCAARRPFPDHMAFSLRNKLLLTLIVAALLLGGGYAWHRMSAGNGDAGFIGSNGRIEATEVDIATRLPGRVGEIRVEEGAFVKAGQVLATMQVQTLDAQLREARAQRQQALHAVASAQAQVAMRQSDKAALLAQVRRAEAE